MVADVAASLLTDALQILFGAGRVLEAGCRLNNELIDLLCPVPLVVVIDEAVASAFRNKVFAKEGAAVIVNVQFQAFQR